MIPADCGKNPGPRSRHESGPNQCRIRAKSVPYQNQYQCQLSAVSRPYQGHVRAKSVLYPGQISAVSGPNQSQIRAKSVPYQGHVRAKSVPYQGQISAVSGPYQGQIHSEFSHYLGLFLSCSFCYNTMKYNPNMYNNNWSKWVNSTVLGVFSCCEHC